MLNTHETLPFYFFLPHYFCWCFFNRPINILRLPPKSKFSSTRYRRSLVKSILGLVTSHWPISEQQLLGVPTPMILLNTSSTSTFDSLRFFLPSEGFTAFPLETNDFDAASFSNAQEWESAKGSIPTAFSGVEIYQQWTIRRAAWAVFIHSNQQLREFQWQCLDSQFLAPSACRCNQAAARRCLLQ